MKAEKEAMKSKRINKNAPRTDAGNFVEGCGGNVGQGGRVSP